MGYYSQLYYINEMGVRSRIFASSNELKVKTLHMSLDIAGWSKPSAQSARAELGENSLLNLAAYSLVLPMKC
jgi:hypothetical protein